MAWSAVTTAAVAALFSPLPAAAAPVVPGTPAAPAVPDSGSRPIPLGSLVLPGQSATPAVTGTIAAFPAATPTLAKIEKKRADLALLGDRLLTLREELEIVRAQVTTAQLRQTEAHAAVVAAEQATTTAAADAYKDAAALPPGTIGTDLHGLGALAGIQRGEGASEQAAGRQLLLAREAERSAAAEYRSAAAHAADLAAQHTRLAAQHRREETALQKLERDNAAAVAAEEAAQQAADRQLGAGYVGSGSTAGKAADPRALAALSYALAQRGDPYVWSEEGPDSFDCSGLMWAAYRTPAAGARTLPRVSRYQYWATRGAPVDRYSLLPGDLLFFSSSSSWTGIHHVAMYAGSGMMVEAPRSGLNVRLVPVRWTRLFQATRVYGPVNGPAQPVPVPAEPTRPTQPNPPPTTTKPAPRPTKTVKPKPTPSKTTLPKPPPPTETTPPPTTPPPTTPPVTTPAPSVTGSLPLDTPVPTDTSSGGPGSAGPG